MTAYEPTSTEPPEHVLNTPNGLICTRAPTEASVLKTLANKLAGSPTAFLIPKSPAVGLQPLIALI